jgi:hypothetical protein
MAVVFDPNSPQVAGAVQHAAPSRPAAQTVSAAVHQTPKKTAEPAPTSVAEQGTNVVFRRDPSGQIYYVFTDAKSGREIQELPPKQVRNVGEGIAELVKELQQKSSNRLEVKG